MKCTNCGSPIHEGDLFCGECGQKLQQGEFQSAEVVHDGPYPQQEQTAGPHFGTELMNMLKESFTAPGRRMDSRTLYSPGVAATLFVSALVIQTLIMFLMLRNILGDFYIYTEIGFGAFFNIFFSTLLIHAIFFGILTLFNRVFLRTPRPFVKTFGDYISLSVILLALNTLAYLLIMIRLPEISLILLGISVSLFIVVPVYMYLKYMKDTASKLDSFYSVMIYFVLTGLVYYIIARIFANNLYQSITEVAPFYF